MAARVALLLHMHQPDYRHPRTRVPAMPWVRLHAVRGYLDVATLALEHGAGLTLNVVPSLLEQLAALGDPPDPWWVISRTPVDALTDEERDLIRQRFVHGHPRMRSVSPRYQDLAGRVSSLQDPAELRDLVMWSNLAWMGAVARRDAFVRGLIDQDQDYTHDQICRLLDLQLTLGRSVLGLWRRLPCVSTSPRTHPILPLLVDLAHARRSLPGLPEGAVEDIGFAWPGDALRQLVEAREVCQALLGRSVVGLWPSEGSVSPEVVALAAQAGFAWLASDQGVLEASERDAPSGLGGPWLLQGGAEQADLVGLFRDHGLSDRVGFVYPDVPGEWAAEDLLAAVDARSQGAEMWPVVLDGENPWESYPDAGEGFLAALFASGRTCAMSEMASGAPLGRVLRLHSGSWIGADFDIWAGHPADWAAWALLAELRRAWEEAGRPEAVWPHIAAAEGSDWFWWFGPQFDTSTHDLFDALFRAHLSEGWRALGRPVPLGLSRPVDPRARSEGARGEGGGSMAKGGGAGSDRLGPPGGTETVA